MNRLAILSTLLLGLLTACEDPVSSDKISGTDEITGTYEATAFTVTDGGSTVDLLAQGASLSMTLDADGSTSGRLFIPEGDEDGSDMDEDMTGTWTASGAQVSFEQSADTFVRDMPFTASGGRLTGEESFGSATLRVVLTR